MFERYKETARRVIFFSRYEASQFGSPYIETEHLLLGLLREDKQLTNRFLRSQAAVESIRKQIDAATLKQRDISRPGAGATDLPLSNECRHVLADAAEEAEKLSDKHIGPEHFLLGLLRQEQSFAAAMLRERGLSLAAVREQLRNSVAVRVSPTEMTRLAQPTQAPGIADFGTDLTLQARDGRLFPLVGREQEMERLIQILCRHSGCNAVLVGEPGIGKKTLVYGLAQRIIDCNVPRGLSDVSVIALDLEVIVAGTKSRQRVEDNLGSLIADSLYPPRDTVFLMDGLHGLVAAERYLQMLTLMKPGLLRGSIRCISTATAAEYEKAVKQESWLERCFQVIEVSPPDEAEAIKILQGIKQRLEKFHAVTYSDEAIQYAVYHATSYLRGGQLPEKALDLMDEAAAWVTIRSAAEPDDIRAVRKEVKSILEREDNAIANHEFEKARYYADERRKREQSLKALQEKYNLGSTPTITRSDIEAVIARWTGLPLEAIRKSGDLNSRNARGK